MITQVLKGYREKRADLLMLLYKWIEQGQRWKVKNQTLFRATTDRKLWRVMIGHVLKLTQNIHYVGTLDHPERFELTTTVCVTSFADHGSEVNVLQDATYYI